MTHLAKVLLYGLAQDARPSTSFPTTQVVDKDLMDMLVRELKDELEARSESKTDNKAWLRRRLHGAIVRDHLDAAVFSRRLASITPR